jgi:hypothetical protein
VRRELVDISQEVDMSYSSRRLAMILAFFLTNILLNGCKKDSDSSIPPYGSRPVIDISMNSLGEIISYASYELNIVGDRIKETHYAGAGMDGVWLNADDTVSDYAVQSENLSDQAVTTMRFNHEGLDGLWFTSDDSLRSYTKEEFNDTSDLTFSVTYNGAGLDGRWLTEDDDLSIYSIRQFNPYGELSREAYYTSGSAGSDLVWFTADDAPVHSTIYEYDADNRKTKTVFYHDAGYDATWFTADDEPGSYSKSSYDETGNIQDRISYIDAGLDSIWFTEDDSIGGYYRYEYDVHGNVKKLVLYIGEGLDDAWFTSDDQISGYVEQSFDADNKVVKATMYYASTATGGDLVPLRYIVYKYDSGLVAETETYTDNGPDRQWFTADDVMGGREVYTPCLCESLIKPLFMPVIISTAPVITVPDSDSSSGLSVTTSDFEISKK